MSEVEGSSTEIKHKGTFDLAAVVKTMRSYLKKRKYNLDEKKHIHTADERELEFEANKKINEYIKVYIDVSIAADNLNDVEVITNNQKIIKQEGRITIDISSKMKLDWMKRFKGKPFYEALQHFYHKNVMGHRITEVEDELSEDVVELTRAIRDTLELEV